MIIIIFKFSILDPKIFKGAKKSYVEFDAQAVEEKMKITPEQVIDYKALCGDKSDNIPGVRGIGDKTAVKLLNEYQNFRECLCKYRED